MPNTSASSGESDGEVEREQPQKKLKITASNGYLARHKFEFHSTTKSASIPPKRVHSKAKLGLLPSLPLDVLFEIFGHLLPLDVLHLARTTKDFRRVLMHRSAKSIWKSALSNVPGLPECLPDMSHPTFANLAFDPHCHNCLASNIRNIDWQLRIRLCVRCAKTCLLSAEKFDKEVKKDRIVLRCVPFSNWSGRSAPYCTIKAKEEFLKQVEAFDGDRSAFVRQKKADRKAWSEHATRCKSWSDSLIETRAQELDNIRENRKDAIWGKLVALGYHEELDYLHKLECTRGEVGVILFDDHPLVKAPKPLTDRIWKKIEPDMVQYMATAKADRLEHERLECLQRRRVLAVDVWNEYRRLNPTNDLMPGPLDIWLWEEMECIIMLPTEVTVDQATFAKVIPKIPRFIESWQHDRMFNLIYRNQIRLSFPRQYSDQLRQLQLAGCVFTCEDSANLHMGKRGYDPQIYPSMWYPEFIHHACNSVCTIGCRPKDPDITWLDKNPALRLRNEFSYCRRKVWSIDGLFFDKKASRTVQKILDACGLDFKTVTAEELDEHDPRIVCLKCSFGYKCDGERGFPVRTWRNAVQHCMKTHWGDATVSWQKISDEDAAEARILEEKEDTKRSIRPTNKLWRCAHCRDKPSDVGKMEDGKLHSHLRDGHNIWKGKEGKDYYRALDCPPQQPLTIKMVPKKL